MSCYYSVSPYLAKMLSTVFLGTFIISGGTLAQNQNDWTNSIIECYSELTKYLNQRNYGAVYRESLTNDSVEIWPGVPTARRDGLVQAEERLLGMYPMENAYIAFREILFCSSDVAVVRTIEYADFIGGGQGKMNGLQMLVRNEDVVKIKLTTFNFV